ncbi:hypothetical protein I6J14_04410 [Streptococcus dysgalactiae]|uniref:hypothetical protein n=1 Tax=Streptococcus dysgalactiae TaxID=1334 RepID=UPI000E03975D|nr:hypothetical protein [Streptococcus dysgalactiae]QQT04526.1 hypothetical protein I6J14_04410 [Streptococcus dysgalactiae]SUN45047.1 phage protein [Streptococcus dysgalactiae subsp. dysgalactiae]SUN49657.1 phage protein [Streptococcus dysgalactiae]
MSENIKEALEYAVKIANKMPETIIGNDGKEYYDRNKYSLVELKTKYYPKTLNLNTLDSLIDYLKSDMNNINSKRLMVIVEGPREVIVCEEDDDDLNRNVLVTVEAIIPNVQFGRYDSPSDFNISLQSLFVNADDRNTVIEFASALKIENGSEIVDDGIGQTATIKQGVASLAKAKAPNPVTLRPYRTFSEVEQPSSEFIFRINQLANMALFEADGGKWRLDAINNIANYLKEELADQTNITILA